MCLGIEGDVSASVSFDAPNQANVRQLKQCHAATGLT